MIDGVRAQRYADLPMPFENGDNQMRRLRKETAVEECNSHRWS